MLTIQATKATLMGRERATPPSQGPSQNGIPVQLGGQKINSPDSLRQANHTEPNLHCEGQVWDAASDLAFGYGH